MKRELKRLFFILLIKVPEAQVKEACLWIAGLKSSPYQELSIKPAEFENAGHFMLIFKPLHCLVMPMKLFMQKHLMLTQYSTAMKILAVVEKSLIEQLRPAILEQEKGNYEEEKIYLAGIYRFDTGSNKLAVTLGNILINNLSARFYLKYQQQSKVDRKKLRTLISTAYLAAIQENSADISTRSSVSRDKFGDTLTVAIILPPFFCNEKQLAVKLQYSLTEMQLTLSTQEEIVQSYNAI